MSMSSPARAPSAIGWWSASTVMPRSNGSRAPTARSRTSTPAPACWRRSAVDLVAIFEDDTPLDLIRRLKPSVLVKGGDYRKETVVGHELVEADGGEVILIDLVPGHSTTRIVQLSGGAAPDATRRKEPAKS